MPWKKPRRAGRTDRLIAHYFERQIAQVDVPEPPQHLRTATVPHSARVHRRVGLVAGRRLPNLVCAFALAAGFAVVILHVGRPSPLAGIIETQAVRYQWTTVLSDTLDAAQKTVSQSFNGG